VGVFCACEISFFFCSAVCDIHIFYFKIVVKEIPKKLRPVERSCSDKRLVFLTSSLYMFSPNIVANVQGPCAPPTMCSSTAFTRVTDGTSRLMHTEVEFYKWLSELCLVKCNTDFTQYRCYKCKSWEQETIVGWITTYYMAEQHIICYSVNSFLSYNFKISQQIAALSNIDQI
jgi:hypothetical protein